MVLAGDFEIFVAIMSRCSHSADFVGRRRVSGVFVSAW